MSESNSQSNQLNAEFQEIKASIYYLRDNSISQEEETKIRDKLIEKVKYLIQRDTLKEDEKRIVHIILTKLYSWNPFLADFQGVGDLPQLISQISSTLDILMETEEIRELNIKYYMDNGQINIGEDKPQSIQLEGAMNKIDNLPTLEQYNGTIIGFINESNENLYFIRKEEDMWMLDILSSETDEYAHALSDDTLSTEAVKETVRTFFTEKDVMIQLRKNLILTEHMKEILRLKIDHEELKSSQIAQALTISPNQAEEYLNLLEKTLTYEEREVPLLKQKARQAFKKLLEPNLYHLIVNLGMDFFTAKKVGKYLIDIGWISEFHKIPLNK